MSCEAALKSAKKYIKNLALRDRFMIHFYTAALSNDTILNHATSFFLTPVQYFWGQKTVSNVDLTYEKKTWGKTALMIALFIPSLIFGTVLRLLSFSSDEVRKSFYSLSNPPLTSGSSKTDPFGTPSGSKTKY